ncbi:MAG: TlyA family RNA methyltransferase, partial [Coriobacteriales bacterium]|nr:TlyA family RNA methyltransferase [Coriobacteriales bacterium]
MSSRKLRLDELLVARGHFASQGQAARAIVAGTVKSASELLSKPGLLVDATLPLTVEQPKRFVSRGGEKLAGALADFGFSVAGLHCIDVGASTGGFTDCLLQQGAAWVKAVDVGYGQLAWQLREDARVTVFERTNIKEVEPALLGAPFDLAVADVSFIGLARLVPVLARLLGEGGSLIALVKPQFELPRGSVGQRGVVVKPAAHTAALEQVLAGLEGTALEPCGLTFSPIKGPKGNIEFFL